MPPAPPPSTLPARRLATRLPALVLGALQLALAACSTELEPVGPRPRLVVVVVMDTLAAGHVSHLGYDRLTTPNLDALARDGVTFEEALSPASYTVASIPSLLTGRLPDRHGLVWYKKSLPDEEVTLSEIFRAAGYATFGAVAVANGGSAYGNDQGFDEFVEVYLGEGAPGARTIERKGRTVHLPAAEEIVPIVRERLDRMAKDERLLLYLHFLQPHGPYDPPFAYKCRFQDERYPGPYREGDGDRAQERVRAGGLDEKTKQEVIHLYDANVYWADESLGAVFDKLRGRGLYDDALIVVTADHGEAFWQHGRVGHGEKVYEEYVRVPLVVKLAGGEAPRGVRIPGLVSTLDVLPSLCDWLDLPAPGNVLDGRSFAELVAEPGRPSRHDALLLRSGEKSGRFGLRTSTAKVVVHVETDESGARTVRSVELYDLVEDPLELVNVAGERPDEAAALARRALAHLAELRSAQRVEPGQLPVADIVLLRELGYTGLDAGE